jgi:beta-arrestin
LLHRDLVAELPFILMHPKPEDTEDTILENNLSSNNNNIKSRNSIDDKQHAVNNNSSTKDDVPNLIQLDG